MREGSSVGQTRVCPDTGEEFIVTWDGGPLLGPRDSKAEPTLSVPKRMYTRKEDKAGYIVIEEEDFTDDLDEG